MPLAQQTLRALPKLAAWVADHKPPGPMILGVSGAQGAGKSTLTALLATVLTENFGLKVTGFSLDDLYLTYAERNHLAQTIHPLLITRGVPGTHDVALGVRTLEALKGTHPGDETPIPAFDKARNDRRPQREWPVWRGPVDIILFEGWCLGARPQAEEALREPVNDLERHEDPDECWRRYVNAQLAGSYQRLFALLDRLILLKVPNMECVFRWRLEQERKLAERYRSHSGQPLRFMDEAELKRFIQHYERLTRWMLEEMPERADVVIHLNPNHRFDHIQINTP